jgi:environmental stress-induced protein Ves
MTPTILRNSDLRRMTWKNGGGETAEVAVFPPSASLETFGWRISMATVSADGAFSVFPGIDRTLVLLNGAGMRLRIDGEPEVTLTTETAPLAFPADAQTTASLVHGPIIDLNVMTRRGQFRHSVEKLIIGEMQTVGPDAGIVMLLSLGDIRAGSSTLGRFDALFVERETTLSADRPVSVCRIRISPV